MRCRVVSAMPSPFPRRCAESALCPTSLCEASAVAVVARSAAGAQVGRVVWCAAFDERAYVVDGIGVRAARAAVAVTSEHEQAEALPQPAVAALCGREGVSHALQCAAPGRLVPSAHLTDVEGTCTPDGLVPHCADLSGSAGR